MVYQLTMMLTRKSFGLRKDQEQSIFGISRFRGDHNNNKMERMNGEVRDREKVMRGLKTKTHRFSGYQLFHNYIRPHEGLNGKTPSRSLRNKGRRTKQMDNTNTKRKQKRFIGRTCEGSSSSVLSNRLASGLD